MADTPIRSQSALELLETHAKALEEEVERLRAALLAWYEASDDEERRWAMELTIPLKDSLRAAPETKA